MSSNPSIGSLVVIALVVGVIAALASFLTFPTYTPYIILTVISVGIIAGVRIYTAHGNVPGTPIPIHILVSLIWTAAMANMTYFLGLRSYTVPSIIVGVILVLTYLLHELGYDVPVPTVAELLAKDVASAAGSSLDTVAIPPKPPV